MDEHELTEIADTDSPAPEQDELDWSAPVETLARRRPAPQRAYGRVLLALAIVAGLAVAGVVYCCRPGPAAARAETPRSGPVLGSAAGSSTDSATDPAANPAVEPGAAGKIELFALPAWDENAYQRDLARK